MWRVGAYLALGLMVGCGALQQGADRIAQDQAKGVVNRTLANRFPQVPARYVTPYSDCVIEGASAGQIVRLASKAGTGVDAEAVQIVTDVLAQPEVINCVRDETLNTLATL